MCMIPSRHVNDITWSMPAYHHHHHHHQNVVEVREVRPHCNSTLHHNVSVLTTDDNNFHVTKHCHRQDHLTFQRYLSYPIPSEEVNQQVLYVSVESVAIPLRAGEDQQWLRPYSLFVSWHGGHTLQAPHAELEHVHHMIIE